MAEIILKTARLVLRTEEDGDAAQWMTHLNTPQVMARLGGPITAEEIAGKLETAARCRAEHGFSFMIVAGRDDGRFIGTCGIGHIESAAAPAPLRGAVQIGWIMRADHWGQGYAQEAARAVLGFAFGATGLETVYGQTSEGNEASWRLMEKLGMQRCADLDYDDPAYPPQDNPTKIYAMARADWRRREGAIAA